jgi:hypothetical protein
LRSIQEDQDSKRPRVHNGEIVGDVIDTEGSQLRRAIENGDTPEILRLTKRDSITPDEVEKLRIDFEEIKQLEAKEAAYENLAEQLINAPEDPEAVNQIFRESGISFDELQGGPLMVSGEEASEEDIMAVEKAIWDEISPGNAPVIVDELKNS